MALDLANIHSLSDFQRNAKHHIRKLKESEVRIGGGTGEPIVRRKSKGEPFLELARHAIARLEEAAKDEGPRIEITD